MGVSLQEDGPTFEVGCPGERLVNVALPDGVPSQARQLRDDWHLTASRHPGQEVVDISQSLSTVQAPFKRRARVWSRGRFCRVRPLQAKCPDSVNGALWHGCCRDRAFLRQLGFFGNDRLALESQKASRIPAETASF